METKMQKHILMRLGILMAGLLACIPGFVVPVLAAEGPVQTQKTGNVVYVYGLVAVLSVLLVISYQLWEKQKEKTFFLLFAHVALANCGYFLQSVASTLTGAMWANRLSYLGSAYLVLYMLLIVLEVCRIQPKRWVYGLLIGISTAAFLMAAGGDWLGLYYKSVDIETVNGMTRLVKEYGPLHLLYPVYLFAYLILMVTAILVSARKKTLYSGKYSVFLTAVVLLNIGVWGVEQIIDVEFEFLSVSYIVTEVMLLVIHDMLRDYGIGQPGVLSPESRMLSRLQTESAPAAELPPGMEELFSGFSRRVNTLSTAERRILNYYIEGHDIADIPELAFISIHTVKKHNRSIYQKLEVASRDELMLYIEMFRCCGRLQELSGEPMEMESGQ